MIEWQVSGQEAGGRLDHFLAHKLPEISRNKISKIIRIGQVYVGGRVLKASYRLRKGEMISFPTQFEESTPSTLVPTPVDFQILFEDDDILVLVKPAGLVVHPGCGHQEACLVHGLLYHCQQLPGQDVMRPGIVHRLDKDTSGVMVTAKSEQALVRLTAAFKARTVKKTYHALLRHTPALEQGCLTGPIGRHPIRRQKMAVRPRGGRHAVTHYQVIERLPVGFCFVEVGLETGRTHQIRVHMADMGCPIAGDLLYGGRVQVPAALVADRQLLHASCLSFSHPVTGQRLKFQAPVPTDMSQALALLRGLMR